MYLFDLQKRYDPSFFIIIKNPRITFAARFIAAQGFRWTRVRRSDNGIEEPSGLRELPTRTPVDLF